MATMFSCGGEIPSQKSLQSLSIKPDFISEKKAIWKFQNKKGFGLELKHKLDAFNNPVWELNLIRIKNNSYKKIQAHCSICNGMSLPNKEFYSLNKVDSFLREYMKRI